MMVAAGGVCTPYGGARRRLPEVEIDPMWETVATWVPAPGAAIEWLGHVLMTWPAETTPLGPVLLVPFAAMAFFAVRGWRRGRRFRFRKVLSSVLSRRYFAHKSHILDLLLMGGNIGLFAIICGQAILSMTTVSTAIYTCLTGLFGTLEPSTLNPIVIGSVWTVVLFAGYEFAYWIDHYLSHKIPFLWAFHKVHHTAEVLSPLTNFRVHPVDSVVFINIVALTNGLITGVLHHAFGAGPVKLELLSLTTVIVVASSVFAQLQHTHIWIPLTGWWGRVVLSPAHHQIHHSADVAHHNKNLGNLIAIFDWMFGTLYVPSKKRPKLVFGLDPQQVPAHDLHEGLVQPFIDAAKHVMPRPARAGKDARLPA